MKLDLGQVVDRYTIDRMLGAGGTAMVYLVRHNRLGTYHALKVLTLTGQSIRDRMEREGRVQAKLNHLNVVAVTDQIDVDGALGLLMEFIDGPSLEAALQRYRLTMGDAETLFAGILAGVRAAHREGLVHRDLKPANVLLARTADGFVPKVTDFGLAKVLEQDSKVANTRSGIAMGTPSYMAPEQIRDARSVDQRADMWSLGCILYELTTRKRTFPGDEALAIYNAVVDGDFVPPRDLVPDIPERVEQAILGCLQVDPASRIPSCDTLNAVLSGMIQWGRADDPATTDFLLPPEVFGQPTPAIPEIRMLPAQETARAEVVPVRVRKGGSAARAVSDGYLGAQDDLTSQNDLTSHNELTPQTNFAPLVVSAADAPTMSVASRGPGGTTPEPAPTRAGGPPGDLALGMDGIGIPAAFGFDTNDDADTVVTNAIRPIDGTLSPFESFDRPRAGMLGFLGGGLLAVGLFGIGVGAILIVILLLVGSVLIESGSGTATGEPRPVPPPEPALVAPAEDGEAIVAPGTTDPVPRIEPAPAPRPVPSPAPVPSAAPVPSPAPVPGSAPAPEPSAVVPVPASPRPAPVVGSPTPGDPAPETPPDGVPGREVVLLSRPYTADIAIDGVPFGRAPQKTNLSIGEHTVRMKSGEETEFFTILVQESGPAKWCYNFGTHELFIETCPQ